jgi:hypothetical protein
MLDDERCARNQRAKSSIQARVLWPDGRRVSAWPRIERNCSFDTMRRHEEKFDPMLDRRDTSDLVDPGDLRFVRRGRIGELGAENTDDQTQRTQGSRGTRGAVTRPAAMGRLHGIHGTRDGPIASA